MTSSKFTTFSEKVAELAEQLAGVAPPEVLEVFAADQRELQAAGVPASVAVPGTRFPIAELIGADGTSVSSADVLAGAPTVVVFYRGAWCPYCNIALRVYEQDLVPALEARGVRLVAISPQSPDGSVSMQQANELSFAVLSDPGNRIAAALGIVIAPSDEAQAAQKQLGLDLAAVNADGTGRPGLKSMLTASRPSMLTSKPNGLPPRTPAPLSAPRTPASLSAPRTVKSARTFG